MSTNKYPVYCVVEDQIAGKKVSYCGKYIPEETQAYPDVEHAEVAYRKGGMPVCTSCMQLIKNEKLHRRHLKK